MTIVIKTENAMYADVVRSTDGHAQAAPKIQSRPQLVWAAAGATPSRKTLLAGTVDELYHAIEDEMQVEIPSKPRDLTDPLMAEFQAMK